MNAFPVCGMAGMIMFGIDISTILAGLLVCCLAPFAAAGEVFSLSVQPDTIRVGLHEPVFAGVTVTNTSGNAAAIDVGFQYRSLYSFSVLGPSGSRKDAPSLYLDGPDSLGPTTIAAGEAITKTLLLNDWIQFDTPGLYTIQVSLPGIETPATVRVEVGARDADNLRAICTRLVAESERGPDRDFDTAYMAARALSSVVDEEAIPFLTSLGKDGGLALDAVDGLVRIATPQSLGALKTVLALRSSDSDLVRSQARIRLLQLRQSAGAGPVRDEADGMLATLALVR